MNFSLNFTINPKKITHYLLIPQEKSDKSLRQFKSEVQQVLMMTARILHSECDSQAIFLVDY
jgi:diadenosine tetraphosphate (Ap4A) HIT family hydrolase